MLSSSITCWTSVTIITAFLLYDWKQHSSVFPNVLPSQTFLNIFSKNANCIFFPNFSSWFTFKILQTFLWFYHVFQCIVCTICYNSISLTRNLNKCLFSSFHLKANDLLFAQRKKKIVFLHKVWLSNAGIKNNNKNVFWILISHETPFLSILKEN